MLRTMFVDNPRFRSLGIIVELGFSGFGFRGDPYLNPIASTGLGDVGLIGFRA